jgi:hypothetical protein
MENLHSALSPTETLAKVILNSRWEKAHREWLLGVNYTATALNQSDSGVQILSYRLLCYSADVSSAERLNTDGQTYQKAEKNCL